MLGFAGAPAATASVGLIAGPAGKFAYFSARGPDGVPHDAAVPFPWSPERYYFPFVYQLSPGV